LKIPQFRQRNLSEQHNGKWTRKDLLPDCFLGSCKTSLSINNSVDIERNNVTSFQCQTPSKRRSDGRTDDANIIRVVCSSVRLSLRWSFDSKRVTDCVCVCVRACVRACERACVKTRLFNLAFNVHWHSGFQYRTMWLLEWTYVQHVIAHYKCTGWWWWWWRMCVGKFAAWKSFQRRRQSLLLLLISRRTQLEATSKQNVSSARDPVLRNVLASAWWNTVVGFPLFCENIGLVNIHYDEQRCSNRWRILDEPSIVSARAH